jgi:VIT1/CCC1 family predicted Fe2+/Mn2+ transporter
MNTPVSLKSTSAPPLSPHLLERAKPHAAMPDRLASKLREIILGGQDGLVNVAGVILGLAAATTDMRIIIAGGLAATFAESISMAAVAYTSALADHDYFRAQQARTAAEIAQQPEDVRPRTEAIFRHWGFEGELLDQVVAQVSRDPEHWTEIMMAHERELQPTAQDGLLLDALLVGLSAVVGSLVPLLPFFFMERTAAVIVGLLFSAAVLFGVGALKAHITVGKPSRSGIQMMLIGIVSALAGYGIGALFSM